MFIYTDDNEIINMDYVQYIYITEKDNMFSLIATFRDTHATIGEYNTKEEAIKALQDIYDKIKIRQR